jgi:uncharacterized low-complexity protein
MPNSTIRKCLFAASVAGLLILGAAGSASSQSKQDPSDKQQSQQATKSISGKVAAIGSGGTSFTLEVTGGGSNQNTLNFIVDKNTQVKGQVRQGTPVTVEYTAMNDGKLLAVSIMAQA